MNGLRSIVRLSPESLRGVEPAAIAGPKPKFEWVDPRALFVEDGYQREILHKGMRLIRGIVGGFRWANFKPPVCVRLPESGGALVCIDGQHTATAAASHPGIEKIPVMVVDAAAVADRAEAFVGHNKNRLNLTPQAIYYAELAAAKNEIAMIVDRACRAAGATIPRKAISSDMRLEVGTTVAVGVLRAVAMRQGEDALVRVLKILIAAGRAPMRSDEIAAVAIICAGGGFGRDAALSKLVASRSAESWAGTAVSVLGQFE